MSGLILKDILNLKKNLKTLSLITIFYIAIFRISGDAPFLSGMILFLFAIQFISSFSYDDIAKWDKYALSLPITRADIVRSKYLLAVIFLAIGSVASFLIDIAFRYFDGKLDIIESLLTLYGLVAMACIFISLLLPLIYKFGVERSRIIILGCAAVPFILTYILQKLGIGLPSENILRILLIISPLFVILIMYLSYLISLKIYENKDM
ncbi:ABC-2 transporter permease [Alloiococcus sp. CFN-8]|uniref:ABC-2 transporter permease n=1 Tax=Alloiococcus sp. CFN-8 TaxID=3416081 RepID=UPI003CE8A3D0